MTVSDANPDKTAASPDRGSRHVRPGDERALSPWRAAILALRGKDIDHTPCVIQDGQPVVLTSRAIVDEYVGASARWSELADSDEGIALNDAIKLARQSLDEVKGQTEYQDQKAARLLTVTTVLSALSGILFTQLLDAHPFEQFARYGLLEQLLLALSYLLFAAVVFSALFGALITFHATRTRFKYDQVAGIAGDGGAPRSRLFFRGILHVRPRAWAEAYVTGESDEEPPAINGRLKQIYFRDLVGETYFVAAKTADKLRLLDPAQWFLSRSLVFLFAWLVSLGAIAIAVPVPKSETSVRLAVPASPVPIAVVSMPCAQANSMRLMLPVAPAADKSASQSDKQAKTVPARLAGANVLLLSDKPCR